MVAITKRKVLRRIYALYLKGVSVEEIAQNLRLWRKIKMSPSEVSDLIDELNAIHEI